MKCLAKIAKAVGWKTAYRVTAHVKTNIGHGYATTTLDVSPWIHAGNISEVEHYVASNMKPKVAVGDINLVMVHKL